MYSCFRSGCFWPLLSLGVISLASAFAPILSVVLSTGLISSFGLILYSCLVPARPGVPRLDMIESYPLHWFRMSGLE